MTLQCAPTCYSCHLIDFDTRCPYNASEPTLLNPGDLDKLFIRLSTEPHFIENHSVAVHSMPDPPVDSKILNGPWVITMENFVTEEECERLIELGAARGYEISKDVGAQKFDGTFDGYANDRRTSTNAWCTEECFKDPLTQKVLDRIVHATGVPDSNSEYLQLLRYEPGQFYRTHHDYISHHTTRQEGVRILTVFLYLNDVEEGGGTNFPHLNITVQPKRGRVLIWPSVFNTDPNQKDVRTEHQALPVIKGIKYGANAWLHQREFKSVFARGCH
jgi:prolyl 4-hydroxylase